MPRGNPPSSGCHQSSPAWLLVTFSQPRWCLQKSSRGRCGWFCSQDSGGLFLLSFWFLLNQMGWTEGSGCPQLTSGGFSPKKMTTRKCIAPRRRPTSKPASQLRALRPSAPGCKAGRTGAWQHPHFAFSPGLPTPPLGSGMQMHKHSTPKPAAPDLAGACCPQKPPHLLLLALPCCPSPHHQNFCLQRACKYPLRSSPAGGESKGSVPARPRGLRGGGGGGRRHWLTAAC